ncbi:UNVERIFIED_CONTAM: hypothetical protein K2H54_072891 [Gekko kuhli]
MENEHSLTADEVLWHFKVWESCELSSEQVRRQQGKYGLNMDVFPEERLAKDLRNFSYVVLLEKDSVSSCIDFTNSISKLMV